MKKWLLISTIINILILQIPLYKNNKVTKVEESINLDLTRINFKTNNSVQKNRVSNSDNNLSSEVKPYINKPTENAENINYNTENIPVTPSIKESAISNEKIEAIAYTKELVKPIESNSEIPQKISNSIIESKLESSENFEIKSSNTNNKAFEAQIVNEKDENILSNGSVKLVKENTDLEYKIIKSVNPVYPKKAQILNLKEKVKIFAEFTVDIKGEVKDITLSSDFSKYKQYDFDKAVEKALNSYKFSSIIYKNQIVEVKFKKTFEFNTK